MDFIHRLVSQEQKNYIILLFLRHQTMDKVTPSESYKKKSWLAEWLLASQEGLCSTELVWKGRNLKEMLSCKFLCSFQLFILFILLFIYSSEQVNIQA
jgi:hypothetical protein